jgi:hypothetical protein
MVVILRFLKIISCLLIIFLVIVNLIGHEGIASDGEITLKEAINIGLDRAGKWNENASLASVTSVDEEMGGTRGATGKRYKWTLSFVAPSIDQQLFLGISKGEVSFVHEGKGPSFEAIKLDDIKFDSPYLVKMAKEKFNLQKGVDWATGYNFTLDSENGKPTVTVLGNDKDSLFTRIIFDAKNGEVVGARHKVPIGGGLLSKRDGTDNLTKKGMAITGVVAGNKQVVIWGDKKPTQFSVTKQPFIEWSQNNGESWTELQVNNYITHAWFDMKDQLYAATEKELWAGITSKSKGTKILSLNHKIETIDYSINNQIAVLSNGKVYYTTNQGKSWEQVNVPKPFHVVQLSDNGDLIGLTEEREILQKTKDSWNELAMPNSNEVVEDMKVINNRLFIATQSGIWARNLQEEDWRKVQVDEMVGRLIKKGEKLFGITDRGEAIYSIRTKKERKSEKVFDAIGSIVWDVDSMGDTLWFATAPDYSWEEMKTPHRR